MSKSKRKLSPEVREYLRQLGKTTGDRNVRERGPEYFRRIAAMRKKHGAQKVVPTQATELVVETPAEENNDNEQTS